MRYWLGPWQKSLEGATTVYRPPVGTRGLIDLRTITADQTFGFFTTHDDILLGSDYQLFGQGHLSELTENKALWASMLGITGLDGTTLLDWLWNTLTVHADPEQLNRPAPLMPTSRSELELHLGGHSRIRVKRFDVAMPEAAPVIARKREQYREYRRLAKLGALNGDPEFHRRILDYWGEKYGLNNPEDVFIPRGVPKEARLPHATTVSDNFDRANENLEASANWALLNGAGGTASFQVFSNQCRPDSTTPSASYGEYQTNLSTDDHTSEFTIETLTAPALTRSYGGANCRVSDNGQGEINSYDYEATIDSGGTKRGRLGKFTGTAPTFTALADEVETINLTDVILCSTDGSSIVGKINGTTTAGPITDTALSGQLRAGIGARITEGAVGDIVLDNFSASDIGAAPAANALVSKLGLMGVGI